MRFNLHLDSCSYVEHRYRVSSKSTALKTNPIPTTDILAAAGSYFIALAEMMLLLRPNITKSENNRTRNFMQSNMCSMLFGVKVYLFCVSADTLKGVGHLE